jgi:hypothetical protein
MTVGAAFATIDVLPLTFLYTDATYAAYVSKHIPPSSSTTNLDTRYS